MKKLNFKSKLQLLACLSMLLCAVDSMAQSELIDTTYKLGKETGRVRLGIYKLEPITIQSMIQYKQECYNDSTEITVYVDPNKKTYIGNGCYTTTLMGGYDIKKWVHKTPTFEDFIEWYIKNVQ